MPSDRDRPEGAGPEIAIRISDGDTERDIQNVRFASPEGEARFVELARTAEKVRVRLSPSDQDVEGHAAATGTAVVATIGLDEDDTEGHAISIHFPDAESARRFRNQLVAAGALTATLALGAGAGIALAPGLQAESGSAAQAISIGTSAQVREGPAFAASQAGSAGTAAQLREGSALSAGQAGSVDTAAQLREGGALSAGQAGSVDTAAQLREGGTPATEEEESTRGGFRPE